MKLPNKRKYLAGVGIQSDHDGNGIYGDENRNLIVSVRFRLPYHKAHRLYNKLSDAIQKEPK